MPGPDIIYVATLSIKDKKYGIVTALGLVSGIIIHTSLVAFGVSAIIANNKTLFFYIKLFGALYLLYLAYKVYVAKSEVIKTSVNTKNKELWQFYKQGFIMNILNPKVTLFFLAFFPSFLFSKSLNTVIQFYALGLIFMLQALTIFIIVALFSNKLSTYLVKNNTNNNYLKYVQIIILIALAVFILK